MRGKTHATAGIVTAAVCLPYYPYELCLSPQITYQAVDFSLLSGALFGSILVGSLLPDIDLETSTISKCKPLKFLFDAVTLERIKHRQETHSLFLVFFLLFGGGLLHFTTYDMLAMCLIGLGVGVGCHIFCDLLSNGVALFAPFSRKRYTLLHMKTGSWLDRFTEVVCFLVFLSLTVYQLIGGVLL